MAHIQPVTYVSRTKDNLTLLTVCILADFQLLQPCPAEQSCTLILFCSWHSTLIPGITWGPCMFVFPTRLEAPGGEEQCLFYFLYLLILEGERKEGERKEGRERGRKRERERERDGLICCSICLCIHWSILVCVPTRNRTYVQPWRIRTTLLLT